MATVSTADGARPSVSTVLPALNHGRVFGWGTYMGKRLKCFRLILKSFV